MAVLRLTRRGFLVSVPAAVVCGVSACGVAVVPGAPEPAPSAQAVPGGTPSPAPSPAPTPAPAAGGPARELVRATSGRPEIALTFHGAGDLGLARSILTTLADRGAAVTVLAIGTWLAQSPDAAKLVTDHGHELGNHTWSHPTLTGLSSAAVRSEIERCRDRIAALTGGPGAFFRPSAAQHATPEVLRLAGAAGYATVLSYDIDSRDFTDPGAAAIRRAVTGATAGSVVSMHLGHPGTLTALPGLLDDLAARGLTAVTASALFR
jgi:peptidoglycan/xylan/chitin deacetylase (PgdA/CDA1 family)